MKARVIALDIDRLDIKALEDTGRIIKNGGLVAFPTETVYGLGADALSPDAAKKIYAAKGRPSDNPLIVHIARLEDLDKIAADVPQKAVRLAEKFWPGPLTMIFKKKSIVPCNVTGGLDTVAVRFPSHALAQKFIITAGGFVAAPSAYVSGRPSPTRAEHVIEDLGERIDAIIDAGAVEIGLESTIIDLSSDIPTILRPSYVTEKQIAEVICEVNIDKALIEEGSSVRPKAPGMKYRHYAPKGDLTVVEGDAGEVASLINELLEEKKREGVRTAVLCTDETKALYNCESIISLGALKDEEEIARHLFDALRALDDMGAEFIYSEAFNTEHIGMAIMNRLLKAAGHKVINTKGKKQEDNTNDSIRM